MLLNDPIGDLITRMRNAQHGRRTECRAPWSRLKQEMCAVLKTEEYVQDVRSEGEGVEREIVVVFRSDRPALSLKRISTPGGRTYVGASGVREYLHGSSTAIVSTSSGVMTHRAAKAKNIGGELLCTVS